MFGLSSVQDTTLHSDDSRPTAGAARGQRAHAPGVEASAGQSSLAMPWIHGPRRDTRLFGRTGEGRRSRRNVLLLYRSRSASRIIFRAFDKAPAGSRPAWFDFERDVARIVASMGLRVVHQAAAMKGDGGVDIYAHDGSAEPCLGYSVQVLRANAEDWPRCHPRTCWEFAQVSGAYAGHDCYNLLFTAGALKTAAALNIKTVDGSAFSLWVASGSASPMRPH